MLRIATKQLGMVSPELLLILAASPFLLPPELNPMDTLSGQGQAVVAPNKQYATIDEQVHRFLGYLNSLDDHEALDTAGILSKKFWLRRTLTYRQNPECYLGR